MNTVTRWRLYTEDTRFDVNGRTDLNAWITSAFPGGANIVSGEGVWKGDEEMSIIIEVVDFHGTYTEADMLEKARMLRDFNKQEAVMLTCELITAAIV